MICDLFMLIQCHDICYVLQDSFDFPILNDYDWGGEESSPEYVLSSSDGEDSDGEIFLTPVNDVDLPSVSSSSSNNEALTLAAHRLAAIGKGHKKHRQVCRTCAKYFFWIPLFVKGNILNNETTIICYYVVLENWCHFTNYLHVMIILEI